MHKLDPVTYMRLTHVAPGVSMNEYATAVASFVSDLAGDILAREDLQPGTKYRARSAGKDIPIAMGELLRRLVPEIKTEEERDNVVFLLVKAIDDALNLGAFYMAGKQEADLPAPVTARDVARDAGIASGEARREAAEKGWQATALRLAVEIMKDGKDRSANKLGNEVWRGWDDPKAALDDPKLICAYLKGLAEGDNPPFRLKARRIRQESSEANRSLPK